MVSGIESIITALLAGCAVVVRCSSQDTHFPLAFLDALELSAPDMAARVAIGWWRTDDEEAWKLACQQSRVVAAAGSDEALAQISRHIDASTKFVAYGNRVSFAILDALPDTQRIQQSLARDIAYSTLLYDQAGCLSPRSTFIVASPAESHRFCQTLLKALRAEAQRLPARQHTLEENAAIARHIDGVRLQRVFSSTDEHTVILSKSSDDFVLTCSSIAGYTLPPALRIADVRFASSIHQIYAELRRFAPRVAAIGTTAPQRIGVDFVADLGAYRVCPIADMQRPPVGWGHEGRQPLNDFTQWIEYES